MRRSRGRRRRRKRAETRRQKRKRRKRKGSLCEQQKNRRKGTYACKSEKVLQKPWKQQNLETTNVYVANSLDRRPIKTIAG